MASAGIIFENSLSVDLPRHNADAEHSLVSVKVYTRHNRRCPKREKSDWARCSCVKWLYIYRDGKYKLVSAKTRSWERAEQKAREIRDSFDPIKQLQRQLEAKSQTRKSQVEIGSAVEQFKKEVQRLDRAEATRAKYNLTLTRLLHWSAAQDPPIPFLEQLDVATTRQQWRNYFPRSLHHFWTILTICRPVALSRHWSGRSHSSIKRLRIMLWRCWRAFFAMAKSRSTAGSLIW